VSKLVYEVIDLVAKQKTKDDKIKILKQNESWALKDYIRGSMDPTIQWLLPTGAPPPYQASEEHNCPSNLLRETTKLAYFAKGSPKGNNLNQIKRESMFIGLLESINPNDALLMIDMINKVKPKGLTKAIVDEAFPGLLRG
jgi:hypothetical protein